MVFLSFREILCSIPRTILVRMETIISQVLVIPSVMKVISEGALLYTDNIAIVFPCTLGSTLAVVRSPICLTSYESCSCWFCLRKGAILSILADKIKADCNEIKGEIM